MALLRDRYRVVTIFDASGDARSLGMAAETFAAMCEGVPIIHSAFLRDCEHLIYGILELLMRSDVMHDLFADALWT